MAGRPVKGNRKRAARAEVAAPQPSITLDVVYQYPNGSTEQSRPTYNNFDEAITRLQSLKADWARHLKRFKADARKKR